MSDTKAQEAERLAEWLQAAVQTYPQMSEDEPGGYCTEVDQVMDEAAALLRTQAARIAELEKAHAIAVEIGAQYAADRDALAAELARMREPLPVQAAVELVSAHQKAAIELGQEMVDDNHQILIAARVALIDALTAHGITKTGAEAIHQDGVSHG